MSTSLAQKLLKHMPLTPIVKLMESLSGHIVPSLGILYVLPIQVEGTMVHLRFYIFDIWDFDLLIGQPLKRLIYEGQIGKLNIFFGKKFLFLMSISHPLNTRTESRLQLDLLEEFKATSLEFLIEPGLEDDAEFFIEEEADLSKPEPLDEFLDPPKPPIELKPLPTGLRYAFQENDLDLPVIISDKLSQEQTLHLITILERHRSALGYLLQDLKGITVLCTHRIPTDPNVLPSRKPQRRLNNTMREVVKKEVLKLLHAVIIYPMPHSEWVSLFKLCLKREA
jgi:hypothetical protein